MNIYLENYARQWLKEHLILLDAENHRIFKLMYSHKNMDRTIDEAVDAMPVEKLDWAMIQVNNSLKKILT